MSISLSTLGAALRLGLVGTLFALAAGTQVAHRSSPPEHLPQRKRLNADRRRGSEPALRARRDRQALREGHRQDACRSPTAPPATSCIRSRAGAPFQALFAADDESVKKLAKAGKTEGEPIVFARGELSVAAPKGSPVAVDADLKGLKAALAAGKVKHVAIANPETAPYGRAAQRIAAEGRAVGAGAAAARHRREHRADGDVRLDRRRRGGVHRQVARDLQGDRAEDRRRLSFPELGTSRSTTAWR